MKYMRRVTFLVFGLCVLCLPALSQMSSSAQKKLRPLLFLSTAVPAGDTIAIKLQGKEFIPTEATVKDGDTIQICNNDPFYHSPFSYSKYNKFGSPKGVRISPGKCMTHIVSNPTKGSISVSIFDELHSSEKLVLTVLPAGDPGGLSGSWRIVQTAGNGARYTGTLRIKQSGYLVSGRAEWDNHTNGDISGSVEGRIIKFTIQYEGGLVGSYEAELEGEGTRMVNGKASSNKGGGTVDWSATRP